MINLPMKFKERMEVLLGEDFEKYEKALEEPPVKAFRVNTDKISVEDFEKINIFGKEKVPYTDNAYYLTYEKAGNHPYHHAGMIYIQEPGAMVPAECIDFEEDWKVLDMCAAPGGKSTQMKNKLSDKGMLISNEIIPSRCKILTGNIERLGLKNTVTTCMDTNKLAKTFPRSFDLIMVDAPCSGEGMFRKEEIAISEWSEENVKMCAERQREILENATCCLKKGGYIIYATCTFSLEENEMVIDDFLKNHPEFEILPVKEKVIESTADGIFFEGCQTKNIHFARRFYPHKAKGEGQFAALLHSTDTPSNSKESKERADAKTKGKAKDKDKNKETVDKTVTDFLSEVLTDFDKEKVMMYNGNPVYFTPNFEIKKGTAFSCGVTIGEMGKNYIKPHHQFFMAMGDKFKRKIELSPDSLEMKKFLHGEEFDTKIENGWAVVTVENCTVGGVKVISGKAKNHYPKGLRSK